jgi:hypothetical protein
MLRSSLVVGVTWLRASCKRVLQRFSTCAIPSDRDMFSGTPPGDNLTCFCYSAMQCKSNHTTVDTVVRERGNTLVAPRIWRIGQAL